MGRPLLSRPIYLHTVKFALGWGREEGATWLQDGGLPHRIVDGLRPGYARGAEEILERVSEHL